VVVSLYYGGFKTDKNSLRLFTLMGQVLCFFFESEQVYDGFHQLNTVKVTLCDLRKGHLDTSWFSWDACSTKKSAYSESTMFEQNNIMQNCYIQRLIKV
jgi:hypothetical protein